MDKLDNVEKTVKKVIERTKMMKNYLIKLFIRIFIFLCFLICYIWNKQFLVDFMFQPFFMDFSMMHIAWVIFMVMMLLHLVPVKNRTMAWFKMREEKYDPIECSQEELFKFVIDANTKAWRVMIVWLTGNACVGFLYLFNIIGEAEIMMLTAFYFLSDYICILFYCPFQSHIMGNKCCVNCRIYDWGHFMMFTPMLFIQNFFCWSLLFTAIIVLIHWEITWNSHPERFYEKSNKTLQCTSCKDKTCQIKRQIKKKFMVYRYKREMKKTI